MHTVLTVSEIRVKGKPYHRTVLPKELSNRLQLQAGDTITVVINTVKRDGKIIWGAKGGDDAQ